MHVHPLPPGSNAIQQQRLELQPVGEMPGAERSRWVSRSPRTGGRVGRMIQTLEQGRVQRRRTPKRAEWGAREQAEEQIRPGGTRHHHGSSVLWDKRVSQ